MYIRPLQRSITLTEDTRVQEEVELCLVCEASVLVSEIKKFARYVYFCTADMNDHFEEHTLTRATINNPIRTINLRKMMNFHLE